MNAKKKALGKGLSALLDNANEAAPYSMEKDLLPVGTIANIAIDAIESNPFQPRQNFDQEALKELAASIKEQGVIQPITVRKTKSNKFQLISGERRFKAAGMAGLSAIPAYVRTATDQGMLEMAIVENIQRENLNPMEVALGYQQLIDECKLTQELLSERLGKARSSIANSLRILKLPGEIQIGLRNESITMGHAKALLSVSDVQNQLDIFHDIIAQNLSVRETEEIVQNINNQEESGGEEIKTPQKKTPDIDKTKYNELQESLSSFYGTKVQIKAKIGGNGNIVIPFKSEKELEKIISLFKVSEE